MLNRKRIQTLHVYIVRYLEVREHKYIKIYEPLVVYIIGANSGSEFVVANTLAKWKKLKPNEITFTESSINKLFCI